MLIEYFQSQRTNCRNEVNAKSTLNNKHVESYYILFQGEPSHFKNKD